MRNPRSAYPVVLAALLAAACSGPAPTEPEKPKKKNDVQVATSPLPSSEAPTPAPTASASTAPVATSRFGRVVDAAGLPLAGATVRATAIAVPAPAGGFRVLEDLPARLLTGDKLDATTDADGYFDLSVADNRPLNIEVAAGEQKALKLAVPGGTTGMIIQLAPTGTVAGQVAASGVTNFEGVDVFIPGTSYVAKADATGRFAIAGVPAGRYVLVAAKAGVGKAKVPRVVVEPGKTAEAPRLELKQTPPKITATDPANGAPGAKLRLTGEALGASSGEAVQLQLNGAVMTGANRLDDFTIEVDVPAGATSGDIVATVGGVTSNALPFQVIKEIAITPRPFKMRVGEAQKLVVTATDTAGKRVAKPAVTWSVDGAALTYDDGVLTAAAAGRATLKAASGGVAALLPVEVAVNWPTVATLAGGERGFADGPGAEARFDEPIAVAVDDRGNIYVCDNATQSIRKLSKDTNLVATVAGGSAVDGTFPDGPGAEARFANPSGVAIDKSGQMFVTEWSNHKVRKITTPGFVVSTFVGTGSAGNQEGQGANAQLKNPKGIAIDAQGNFYVTEMYNHLVRKISPSGIAQRYAGDGAEGDVPGHRSAARFSEPTGIAVDAAGAVYVCDSKNHKVKQIDPATEEVVTLAGTGVAGFKDGPGEVAQFDYPVGIAVSKAGDVYVSDSNNQRIRKIVAGTGEVVTVAGSGGKGIRDGYEYDAMFNDPSFIAFDLDGNLIVADRGNNRIRQIRF